MSVRGWLKLSHGLGTVGPAAATLMVTNTPVLRCPHVDTEVTAYTYICRLTERLLGRAALS